MHSAHLIPILEWSKTLDDVVKSVSISADGEYIAAGLGFDIDLPSDSISQGVTQGANELLQVGTTVVAISAIFFYISPTIAIYSIIPIPVIIWGSFRFQSRISPHYAEVRKEVGLLNSLLSNNLSGISTIKSFTSEELEVERVRAASQAYREANRRAIRLSAAFVPLIRMAILVGFTATLLHGGFVTLDGGMAIASYSVMIFIIE